MSEVFSSLHFSDFSKFSAVNLPKTRHSITAPTTALPATPEGTGCSRGWCRRLCSSLDGLPASPSPASPSPAASRSAPG